MAEDGTGIRGETVDEILWLDQTADPSELGMSRLVNGAFKFVDSVGVFDPRTGGSGITESQHELLDTLTHDIDETSYDEVIYSGNLVQTYTVWETAAKLKKVREETYSYSGNRVTQAVTIQYDATGATKMTMTEIYTYSGSRVTSVARTKS